MMNPKIEQLYPLLTPEQKRVISHSSGPLLVVAGPGSGKSLSLILRAANLISLGNALPQDIVITTFSRAAATELSQRFAETSRALGGDPDWLDTQITTIHGFCQKFLRECGHRIISPEFTVLDDLHRLAFIDSRLPELSTREQREEFFRYWRSPENASKGLLRVFDQIVDRFVDVSALVSADNKLHRAIGTVYREYEQALKDAGVSDFSHLLRWAHDLLADPGMEHINERSYAMVDEYQDSNPLQEKIFRLWTARSKNLMAVGDDDQSIYGFRGAQANNMARFPTHVPGCETVHLSTNFRSHDGIVAASSNWIRENRGFASNARTELPEPTTPRIHSDYPSVMAVDGNNSHEEADRLAGLFAQLHRDEVVADYDQIALLLHSVRDDVTKPYTDAFKAHGIPYSVRKSERLFDRPEVKGMVGALAIVFDALSQNRDGGHPAATPFQRYLVAAAKSVWKHTPKDSVLHRALVRWPAQIRDAIERGATLDRSLHDYCYTLLSIPPFSKAQLRPASAQCFALWSRCIEAFHVHYGYRHIAGHQVSHLTRDFFGRFLPLVYGETRWQCIDTETNATGQVQVMTVHQSKGLEFPVVAVGSLAHDPGIRKGGLDLAAYSPDPSEAPDYMAEMMEPNRCKYTAFTRAERLLILTGSGKPVPTVQALWTGLPRWSSNTQRALSKQRFPLRRPSSPKPAYSVTGDLELYERCPKQYLYFRSYGFENARASRNVVGDIVHRSIDAVHQDVLRGGSVDEHRVCEIVDRESQTIQRSSAPDENYDAVEVAFQQVARYVKENRDALGSILASELPLLSDEGDFLWTGRADLVSEDSGSLVITDFKTGNRKTTSAERVLAYERQLMLYAHMAAQKLGRPVSQARIYWTSEPSVELAVQSIEVSDSKISEAINQSALIAHAIQSDDFTVRRRPSREECGSCPLRTVCRRDGTILDSQN